MIRINLAILFYFIVLLRCMAQTFTLDTSAMTMYEKRKLTFDQANIVSSYYSQDGNHSAITGGIGTEKLTDVANTFDIKFHSANGKGIKSNFGFEIGVDTYTSASSDKIDYKTSSASSQDVRVYPSFNYSRENEITKSRMGGHLSFSNEFDYTSIGGGINYSKSFNNENTDVNFKLNGFYDIYRLIYAQEFRRAGGGGHDDEGIEGTAPRKSVDASISLSQVMTPKLQASLILDAAYQNGFLSTPFHRVYLNDGSLVKEVLPDTRYKLPIGLRMNWMITDKIVSRNFYRFFKDSWGMKSHTIQTELPIRFSSALVVGPYARYYKQSGNKYFGAFETLKSGSPYVSSDYDLSDFSSSLIGISGKYNTFKQGKYVALSSIELRAGIYKRSDGLKSWIVTVGLGFDGKKN